MGSVVVVVGSVDIFLVVFWVIVGCCGCCDDGSGWLWVTIRFY